MAPRAGTLPGTGTGLATAVAVTVFGKPAGQTPHNQGGVDRRYADVINVTVTY